MNKLDENRTRRCRRGFPTPITGTLGTVPNILVPVEIIASKIFFIRGQKIMLSSDLASLYDVEVRASLQAVKRNIKRFPEDFMFQLSKDEWKTLRSQFVTLEKGRGKYPKYLPYAFTE